MDSIFLKDRVSETKADGMSTGLFSDEEDGYNLDETKYKLKIADPNPDSSDDLSGLEDMGGEDDIEDILSGGGDEEAPSDKPFDDEPFDAGVEADEDSDPEKYIQQLAGKLGQSLRKYSDNNGQPDFDLEKFAINSIISATHTAEMDAGDQKDIINKIKSSGKEDDINVDVNVNTGGENADVDQNQDNSNDNSDDNSNDDFDLDVEENNSIGNFNIAEHKINGTKKIGKDFDSGNIRSNFVSKDNIVKKLKEHHNMDFKDYGKYDSEEYILSGPDITETPEIAPAPVKPEVDPDVKPSRRSKPWRPSKQPKVNPKADGEDLVMSEGEGSNGRVIKTKYLDSSRLILTISLADNEVDVTFNNTDELISEPSSIGEPWVYAYESTDSPDDKTYRVGVKFFGDPDTNMEVAGVNDDYIDKV